MNKLRIASISMPSDQDQAPQIDRKRTRVRPLKRYVLESDAHSFFGRIYDLGIIGMHFETYDQLAQYADCTYAFDVGEELSNVVRRVDSLNLAGDMIWPTPIPANFKDFPVSRYDWLTIAADVFLMRYVSVVDCACLLVNEVYELGVERRKCSVEKLAKNAAPDPVIRILQSALDDQGNLRSERNTRFHHGAERGFTDDATTFQTASVFENRGRKVTGTDAYGARINLSRSFNEGLVELQREPRRVCRRPFSLREWTYDRQEAETSLLARGA